MANVKKYTLRQAQAVIAHSERTGRTHANRNIDMAKTAQNYALWPLNDPDKLVLDTGVEGQSSGRYAWRRLRRRLAEVSCLQRNDVNVLCEWDLHLGVDVPPGYENKQAFFRAAVRLMATLYGPENVVYAWVHEDEVNSHLHFGFIPVIAKPLKLRKNASAATRKAYEEALAAGKTHVERLDANSVINRRHLQDWHGWFRKYMTKELGYDPGVYTGVTQFLGGNTTVKELTRLPEDYREKRNAKAAAYHEARRARADGQSVGLETQITAASPLSLADKVKDAMVRSDQTRNSKKKR